jgi:uncharacterized protein YlxW (UPF0749 family)
MTEKRFIVIDVPYENGEPFLYKKMLDKTTKKEYDNTLKGIDEMCDLANKLHEEKEQLQSRINDYDVALKTLQDLTERKLKENEQLKHQIETYKTGNALLKKTLDKEWK